MENKKSLKIKKLLKIYKRRIKKDYLTTEEKELIETYLDEFVKDFLVK